MATIKNIANSIVLEIFFVRNSYFDYDPKRNNYENWIPFILNLELPNRHSGISEQVGATMSIIDIDNFILGVDKIVSGIDNQENELFSFTNSEAFFEMRFENLSEDNVVEIELWINLGAQTEEDIFAYDEGVRFIIQQQCLISFINDLKQEVDIICHDLKL